MQIRGVAAALLLALQVLCPVAGHAQTTAAAVPAEEATRQDAIYRSQGDKVPKGYVIGRPLSIYASALPAEFDRMLFRLTASDRWMDIGAGMGQAIIDYYGAEYDAKLAQGSGARASAVAVSIEDRRTAQWHHLAASLGNNRIQYYFGKPLEQYALDELGKFQVITDFIGGFSYAPDLSAFLEKTLSFLHVNGEFFTVLQDVDSSAGTNAPFYPNAPYLTEINQANGSKIKVCEWLKSVGCVQVSCELRPNWRPPVEVYRVQKVCDNVTVPRLMNTHYAAGTPPERRYRLASPPAPALEGNLTAREAKPALPVIHE